MHLLAAQPGAITDGSEALDLEQSPADIIILSAADTELSCLAHAHDSLVGDRQPSLRLANQMQLSHNMSVDLYIEQTVKGSKLVIARVLGGEKYWPYGLEQLSFHCKSVGIPFIALPGDDKPDRTTTDYSTVDEETFNRVWAFFTQGGIANAAQLLLYCQNLLGRTSDWREPSPLPPVALHWPGLTTPDLKSLKEVWINNAPVTAIVFYRALLQAGNLASVNGLVEALRAEGVNALPLAVTSLKSPTVAEVVENLLEQAGVGSVINGTAFALSSPGADKSNTPFDKADCPVFQVIFSGGTEEEWRDGNHGLSARDIAMNVALPEVDGRILTRAVSFKSDSVRHEPSQSWIVNYKTVADRLSYTAQLAANWMKLGRKRPDHRKVAVVLANYPNKDGRLANGVGLDTPQSVADFLASLVTAGYDLANVPSDSAALMDMIRAGVTNNLDDLKNREVGPTLELRAYQKFFETLPPNVQKQITEQWGEPQNDPFVIDGAFWLPAQELGSVAVAIQPARGYNIDPVETYHSPDLVPPHNYIAFYAWLRLAENEQGFAADAVIHFGKHGNLEWLPGKGLALSSDCIPDAVLGPMPQLYPFIVNDPGEGSQAKRRTSAVVVDHLTPPLTRADTYGPLRELELLIDEYYEAAGIDPRRLPALREKILSITGRSGLDKDCGIDPKDDAQTALSKLDNHLCELKETQIRGGLHIFGASPKGNDLSDLLVALTRVPRGDGEAERNSIIRAIARDLDLPVEFDPLDCELGEAWTGPMPDLLMAISDSNWRTNGDTVERLELLALLFVSKEQSLSNTMVKTQAVLSFIEEQLLQTVTRSGKNETAALLRGLDGRFIAPGPSGAPSRGRLDVLPTGRNFYSVDTRAVPTATAWMLGWKSASLIIERYLQENGDWPRQITLSAWGTANMRTGGDDIAQALALMGVQPQWDQASGRVTGFEIMPLSVLARPRVDVTLRISGFFRDAFPQQIALLDSAVRAVAELDEPHDMNAVAANASNETANLINKGVDVAEAKHRAAFRIFGSKPGAYGAGLQAYMDEGGWHDGTDLANSFLTWGSYAYGQKAHGQEERELFETKLTKTNLIVHNQDNREHDILDSDDYYQFEGGLSVTVKELKGEHVPIYHNDHSRPERPRIQTLDEEISRIVRARAVNPKWINAVMKHGYKGAFEIAATVDYLFAFSATTASVKDHHFDLLFESYVEDDDVREFFEEYNPDALQEMIAKFIEAQDRNLWSPRANSTYARLKELQKGASA